MITLKGSIHRIKSSKTLYHPRFHSESQRVNNLLLKATYGVVCTIFKYHVINNKCYLTIADIVAESSVESSYCSPNSSMGKADGRFLEISGLN